jgi:hypothetical protein
MPSLFVKGWRFLERLPLLTIMAKDDQLHLLTLDQIKEFSRAGAQLLLVVIQRPSPTIRGKKALLDDCIDHQQNLPGLWQAYQNRLMSRGMPTGFKQRQAGQELGVPLNQPVAQCWLIPVHVCGGKARMSAPRQFIVFALDDEFRLCKGIVISGVVHVEMGTDEEIEVGEMLQHIFFIFVWWRSWWWRVVRRESTIDENVLPIDDKSVAVVLELVKK